MDPIKRDLSVFKKFNFERPPIAVKYMMKKPEGINRINRKIALCEMLGEAHKGTPFYVTKDDFECVGPFILGMVAPDDLFESGQVGYKLGIFEEPRANSRFDMLPLHQSINSHLIQTCWLSLPIPTRQKLSCGHWSILRASCGRAS